MKIYHGKELRKGRYSQINRPYLITTVTYERRELFRNLYLGRLLVKEMQEVTRLGFAENLAWVIMPDHLHWLVTPKEDSLQSIVNRVKSKSAITINRRQNMSRPVWQRGFHDHAVRYEEDIQEIARYILANPLRAGLVRKIGNYSLWDAVWF